MYYFYIFIYSDRCKWNCNKLSQWLSQTCLHLLQRSSGFQLRWSTSDFTWVSVFLASKGILYDMPDVCMYDCTWFQMGPHDKENDKSPEPCAESRPLGTEAAAEWAAGPEGWDTTGGSEPELVEQTGLDSFFSTSCSGISLPLISSWISGSECGSELSESSSDPSSSSSHASSSSSSTAWRDWCNNWIYIMNSDQCSHKSIEGSAIRCASELPCFSACFLLISWQSPWGRSSRWVLIMFLGKFTALQYSILRSQKMKLSRSQVAKMMETNPKRKSPPVLKSRVENATQLLEVLKLGPAIWWEASL